MKFGELKFKGVGCFDGDWVGLDCQKPINVIIGRNNSGKTQFVDAISRLAKGGLPGATVCISGEIDEIDSQLQAVRATTGVKNDQSPIQHLVGTRISWERRGDSLNLYDPLLVEAVKQFSTHDLTMRVRTLLAQSGTPFSGKVVYRVVADRDVRQEKALADYKVSCDGGGLTNFIRHLLHSSEASISDSWITKDLLSALNEVFLGDSKFESIAVKNHLEQGDVWEIYLYEDQKAESLLVSREVV